MADVVHIVAFDKNGVIGVKDQLPFTLPEDLQTFKSLTEGSLIVMGYNTYDSIMKNHMKGKTDFLPDRKVVVVCSNNPKAKARQETLALQHDNVNFLSKETFSFLLARNGEPVVIVGGAQLYAAYRPSLVIATSVDTAVPAGTPEEDLVTYPHFGSLTDEYKKFAFKPLVAATGIQYQHNLYFTN